MGTTRNPFHAALMQRVSMSGDTSPSMWNFTADIVRICANYMDVWTNRFDDAWRIPDVLDEASARLRDEAREVVNQQPPAAGGEG